MPFFCAEVRLTAEPLWIQNLDRWQTLIGAAVVLLAALITAYMIHRQIWLSDYQEKQRLERLHAGARATLPLILSPLVNYAAQMARRLENLLGPTSLSPSQAALNNFTHLTLDSQIIEKIQRCIEIMPNPSVTEALRIIIFEFQVLQSRTSDIGRASRRLILQVNIQTYIRQAAKIMALSNLIFPYARNERDDVDLLALNQEIVTALNLMDFHQQVNPELYL